MASEPKKSVSFGGALGTGVSGFEVDGGDVVKLVLQFLHEQGLTRAARELQEESGVALNTVENKEHFAADIKHGRWESVLPAVSRMKLPSSIMSALYEQVVVELLECREVELAKEMLRNAPPLQLLRAQEPERFMSLDQLASRPAFDAATAYGHDGGKASKERRRHELAARLLPHLSAVPPSRLLALVGGALKWQQHAGSLPAKGQYDLFKGMQRSMATHDLEERAARRLGGQVKFGSGCHALTAAFTPDGTSLISGSLDGFIEVWELETCKLRRDLPYQAVVDDERFMMHDEPVRSLAVSKDGEQVASGAMDGTIKVWRLATGKRFKLLERAHTGGVTSLCFSPDGGQVLSGGMDMTCKVHGLKSGRLLKDLRGHTSYVNAVCYDLKSASGSASGHDAGKSGAANSAGKSALSGPSKAVSGSSDGTVKVWDLRTAECSASFTLGAQVDVAVHTLLPIPEKAAAALVGAAGMGTLLLAVGRSAVAHVVTLAGTVVRSLGHGGEAEMVAAALSPSGKFAYCAADDGKVYCFDLLHASGPMLEQTFLALGSVTDKADAAEQPAAKRAKGGRVQGLLGLLHHPHRNLVASFADDGLLKVWRP